MKLLSVFILIASLAEAQQIAIPRIDAMPNQPSPYFMRDWRQVARGYDAYVFNDTLSGQYLPLVWFNSTPVNYPSHSSFGLQTVVGTTDPASTEAINAIPAVVGATLSGIDKSTQNSHQWALMCEEYFNRRPSENVYLNGPATSSGDDWWYDVMPNIFFYELAWLYPGTGDFQTQFPLVADRWRQALVSMGGSVAPWQKPSMDYRGWYLASMTPNATGVHEPEASGSIAWLQYMAFKHTGDQRYRVGAEWAMEFLNAYPSNPAYELQLSYGTFAAARMNAELGTTYDVEKMVNWCFNVGPLRSWGAIVGTWGSYDVSGLIGEVNGNNDYAFLMNTFEQAGALVPLVRYDDRFARSIGKWMLNAANAARLFYPNYLPDANQDSREWSRQYDSSSVIAHEAIRQQRFTATPYATGDAITGGWGQTTLALYGSSHVGIFGGIIDTTNIPKILRLNLLATDYYRDPAYPSFLYYNPYATAQSVSVQAGGGAYDLYDGVSNTFLARNVSGATSISIPADGAVVLVIIPSGGTESYDLEKFLVNGIVVDYRSSAAVTNHPPRIKSLAPDSTTIVAGHPVTLYCAATDRENDSLQYSWIVSAGSLSGNGDHVTWTVPAVAGQASVSCSVTDGKSGAIIARDTVQVVVAIDHPTVIQSVTATPRKLNLNAASRVHCLATDADGDSLSYIWSADAGSFVSSGSGATWTAPGSPGNYVLRCRVDNGKGASVFDSIGVEVRDFSLNPTGALIASYAFQGNALDGSGNGNNGTVVGAVPVGDHLGHADGGYAFNGVDQSIRVANTNGLNFQNAITVAFWMKIGQFYSREQYPVSHGNWQNRWKVSISNNRIRWTVKTSTGTKDLDSETLPALNAWYHVACRYDGKDSELFLNGALDAFSPFTGAINTTTIDLTIGQVLPGDNTYNFNGVLDGLRVYDYGLSVNEIASLAGIPSSVDFDPGALPRETTLRRNYPNPFNPATTLEVRVASAEYVRLDVFDLLGRRVATLIDGFKNPGIYDVRFDGSACASGMYIARLTSGSLVSAQKMLLMK